MQLRGGRAKLTAQRPYNEPSIFEVRTEATIVHCIKTIKQARGNNVYTTLTLKCK